jgi:ribosomal-protein-alanine N-acetyltransferase
LKERGHWITNPRASPNPVRQANNRGEGNSFGMPEDSLPPPSGDAIACIGVAQPSDIDELAQLEAKAFSSDRLSRRRLLALIKSPSAIVLVARGAKGPLGYALGLTRRSSRTARLYSLAVDPDRTGQGIGARLLAAAEAAAAARGCAVLRLEVRADNGAAIGLYESRGYRIIGRRACYYEDGAEALRYERDLSDPTTALTRQPLGRAA